MKFRILLKTLMKYSLIGFVLQCIFFTFLLAERTDAQSYKNVKEVSISVSLKDASLVEAFNFIELETDFIFNFDNTYVLNSSAKINYQKRNTTVADLLLKISKEGNLRFRQVNNNINVSEIKEPNNISQPVIEIFLQDRTITGKVISEEDGSGIPGVNILIQGTLKGTITDTDGNYKLDISDENTVLIFSAVGYKKQEVNVGNQSVVDVVLVTDIAQLEELVVVGYGIQKKSDVTGTVGSLPRERLEMTPNLDITQAIQGAIPGVMIHTNTAGARPDQTILVRGRNSITASNDPLIIVDGIPYGGPLSDINPYDIESLEVLKDASAAAIYGSRGANGVILITTKEGGEGKPVFSYDGRYSVLDVTKVSRMLTGPEFYDFKMTRNAAAMTLSEEEVYLNGTWTNWTDLALRTGHSQEHNLSVSGGFNNTKYYIGGGYINIKGVAKNDDFTRFSSRINV